jgi:hypothetical protein
VRHLLLPVMTHTPKERLNVSNSAPLLPQPDSHMIGCGTNSSNKIDATESTNQLIGKLWAYANRDSPVGSADPAFTRCGPTLNEGHGFSRAVIGWVGEGFSPWRTFFALKGTG